jgi:hypothetical protein
LTVTRTWASPYRVDTALPVAVPSPLLLPVDVVELFAAVVTVVGVVVADAVWTVADWGWKARTPAVPAMVAPRTMGDRRIIKGLAFRR